MDALRILVLGAAGMLGRKLIERLLSDGGLAGRTVTTIDAFDVVRTDFGDGRVAVHAGDISDPATVDALVALEPDVIFHLAAVVSGEAEADVEKGYRINLDGTQNLFDAIVARPDWCPRVVFASSLAVYGAPFPETIPDHWHLTPRTSYGTQKAIGELLLSDFSRRGFMDGLALRLPTVCVRPGLPNAAASGFFSSIIREPLVGKAANLPVPDSVVHWFASPRATIGFLAHAAELDTANVGTGQGADDAGLGGLHRGTARRAEAGGRCRRRSIWLRGSRTQPWPRSWPTGRHGSRRSERWSLGSCRMKVSTRSSPRIWRMKGISSSVQARQPAER